MKPFKVLCISSADTVKAGMLPSKDIITALAKKLKIINLKSNCQPVDDCQRRKSFNE